MFALVVVLLFVLVFLFEWCLMLLVDRFSREKSLGEEREGRGEAFLHFLHFSKFEVFFAFLLHFVVFFTPKFLEKMFFEIIHSKCFL